jgi:hypothetical protein
MFRDSFHKIINIVNTIAAKDVKSISIQISSCEQSEHYRFKTQPSVSLYVSPCIVSIYLFLFLFNECFFEANIVITHLKGIIHLFVIR